MQYLTTDHQGSPLSTPSNAPSLNQSCVCWSHRWSADPRSLYPGDAPLIALRAPSSSSVTGYYENHAWYQKSASTGPTIPWFCLHINFWYLGVQFLWSWLLMVAHTVKHLPTMRETHVGSLGQEDPLEKEMATHSSTFAWRIPWMEEPGGPQSLGSQRVRQDWATSLSLFCRSWTVAKSRKWLARPPLGT